MPFSTAGHPLVADRLGFAITLNLGVEGLRFEENRSKQCEKFGYIHWNWGLIAFTNRPIEVVYVVCSHFHYWLGCLRHAKYTPYSRGRGRFGE